MKRSSYHDFVTGVLIGAVFVIGARLYERRLFSRVLGIVNARLSQIQYAAKGL